MELRTAQMCVHTRSHACPWECTPGSPSAGLSVGHLRGQTPRVCASLCHREPNRKRHTTAKLWRAHAVRKSTAHGLPAGRRYYLRLLSASAGAQGSVNSDGQGSARRRPGLGGSRAPLQSEDRH